MSISWPLTVHKNDRFDRLVPLLCQTQIIEMMPHPDKTRQVLIKEPNIFLEALKIVFLLYITPNDTHLAFSQNVLVAKGQAINLSFAPSLATKARDILNVLITHEDDAIYEAAFNALIAIYIGSLRPVECLFPHTYIVELGRRTHEFDIFCGIQYPQCLLVETTRGFTKEYDRIEESYAWHFKKAIFRK